MTSHPLSIAAHELRATRAALNRLWLGQGRDEALAQRLGLSPEAARYLRWLRQPLARLDLCSAAFTLGFDDACPGRCLPRQLRSALTGVALPVRAVRAGKPGLAQGWVRTENQTHHFLHGSLGAILRRSNNPARLLALSAGHVFGAAPGSTGGDIVSFSIDGGLGGTFSGRLFDWQPSFNDLPTDCRIDAGLAEVSIAALSPLTARPGDWPVGSAAVSAGDALRLRTRGASIGGGSPTLLSASLCIDGDDSQTYQIVDALCWTADEASQAGDSGAPVWNSDDALVAIHAGSAPEGMDANVVAVPIAPILDWAGAVLVCRGEPLLRPIMSQGSGWLGQASPDFPPAAPVAPAAPAASDVAEPSADGNASPSAEALTLARTMWAEARGLGESLDAVAHVVLNRVDCHNYFGNSVVGVCTKPWQFSCWNRNDPNLPKLLKVDSRDARFAQALAIATGLLAADPGQRVRDDPTVGATHYYAWRLVPPPKWARGLAPCVRLGGHDFFNNVA